MKFIKTFESYNNESEFISDVVDILKTYNISPPSQFVEENLSELELDKEQNWLSMKFSKNWSGELKYL